MPRKTSKNAKPSAKVPAGKRRAAPSADDFEISSLDGSDGSQRPQPLQKRIWATKSSRANARMPASMEEVTMITTILTKAPFHNTNNISAGLR